LTIIHKLPYQYSIAMVCGGRPNHPHHYIKGLCAANILDNTTIFIFFSTTLPRST